MSFTQLKRRLLSKGDFKQACFIGSCRLFMLNVLIYLLIFSESHHKFMLVGIVMSQLAIKYYQIDKSEDISDSELYMEHSDG